MMAVDKSSIQATRGGQQMVLSKMKDFVGPTLQVLEALGGEASLKEIEDAFYKRFASFLDPSKDWNRITPNHGKEMWRDYCGSRVAYQYLRPEGYIGLERHPGKGPTYKLTAKGRAKLQSR
jgi:hypothetical protein